jgi:hypothetical protein
VILKGGIRGYSRGVFCFLLGVFVVYKIIIIRYHILRVLLRLEFFMLRNLYILSLSIKTLSGDYVYLFAYFVLSVCEACIAVSLILKLVRFSGRDSLGLVL